MKNAWMTLLFTLLAVSSATALTQGSETEQEQARRDRLHAAVQKICPVSGQTLGAHGDPIKVKIGKEEVFLCCRECAKKQVDRKHWGTIHANFAKAQGICPIMKKELPKKPKYTVVEGQIVYVCCPPCTKKIEADSRTYTKKVDDLYLASLKDKTSRR